MTLDEKIIKYAQRLPASFQEELLNYVEYLLMKAQQQEKEEWGGYSIAEAMRGMEEEPDLYSLSDLKETFS